MVFWCGRIDLGILYENEIWQASKQEQIFLTLKNNICFIKLKFQILSISTGKPACASWVQVDASWLQVKNTYK